MYPLYQNPQFPNIPTYTPPQFPPQTNTSPRLICKQVGSIDEAKSAIIDPFSLYLFVDFSTGKIYVKKMGDNGQSELFIYNQEAMPKQIDPMTEIRQHLASIDAKLGGINGKSVPGPTGDAEPHAGDHQPAGTENAPGQPGAV
jgi:hypothetical protein